jgi:large subunit ribosomal protein L6
MSRLGKKPIEVPDSVEVTVDANLVKIKGPKGELQQDISSDIEVAFSKDDKLVTVSANREGGETRARHGLYRSLIRNMVDGVSKGFVKELLLEGVGYRVAAQQQKLTLQVGYCHAVEFFVPKQVKVELDGNTKIKLESHDKQLIGQVAAEIRSIRKPEPYKGKGIRYADEVIRKKVGKAAAK